MTGILSTPRKLDAALLLLFVAMWAALALEVRPSAVWQWAGTAVLSLSPLLFALDRLQPERVLRYAAGRLFLGWSLALLQPMSVLDIAMFLAFVGWTYLIVASALSEESPQTRTWWLAPGWIKPIAHHLYTTTVVSIRGERTPLLLYLLLWTPFAVLVGSWLI